MFSSGGVSSRAPSPISGHIHALWASRSGSALIHHERVGGMYVSISMLQEGSWNCIEKVLLQRQAGPFFLPWRFSERRGKGVGDEEKVAFLQCFPDGMLFPRLSTGLGRGGVTGQGCLGRVRLVYKLKVATELAPLSLELGPLGLLSEGLPALLRLC